MWRIFLKYLPWEPGGPPESKIHQHVNMPPKSGALNFTYQANLHWASRNSPMTVLLCLWVASSGKLWFCVFTWVSGVCNNGWPCDLNSEFMWEELLILHSVFFVFVFVFLLIFWWEWQLSSTLKVKMEICQLPYFSL